MPSEPPWSLEEALRQERAAIGEDRPWALCLSGGGIRSATFSLGVLQGLARKGLLQKFHYLSTVSGGGYIGSWLTAWIRRAGREAVMSGLAADQEPREVRHLRAYSNYLDPKLGMFSADTWTLAATILRNLILNWSVLVPLVAAALLLPRFHARIVTAGWTAGVRWLFFGAVLLGFWGIFSVGRNLPSARGRGLDQISFFRQVVFPLFTASWLLSLCWAYMQAAALPPPSIRWFALFGVLLHFAAWLPSKLRRPKTLFTFLGLSDIAAVAASGALGGVVLALLARTVFPAPHAGGAALLYATLAVPLAMLAFLLATTLYIGLASFVTTDEDREWWARAGAWCLIGMVFHALVHALVFYGPHWVVIAGARIQAVIAAAGGIAGLITIVLGKSMKSPAKSGAGGGLYDWAPKLAAPVFAALILVGIAAASTWLLGSLDPPFTMQDHLALLTAGGWYPPLLLSALFLALVIAGTVMGCYVNVNKFSLHAMYRNRLIRAYLGASNPDRRPDPFTGFDPNDNLRMHVIGGGQKPFHVLNCALNLAGDPGLAWQERKAESFTVTPLHAGSWAMNGRRGAYRPAAEYASRPSAGKGKEHDGISLGAAVTISGAAANPNMGYNSSPLVAFLLTFFNGRLGAWLGNPGEAGERTWRRIAPVFAVRWLFAEAMSLTTDRSPYVNLSDGGHFENLGLYEMVLRRCPMILVCDNGQDSQYTLDGLANALRKVRVDFGVTIALDCGPILRKQRHFATGVIHYPGQDPGLLLVIKPVLTGDEPADIYHYHATHPDFPQQTTADQWFDESQFESYRLLGAHSVEGISPQMLSPAP